MLIGINQASLPGSTLLKKLQWGRKYGFPAVELICAPVPAAFCGMYVPGLQLSEVRELKEALDGYASITLHAPFQNTFDTSLVSVNAKIREASVQDIILTIRLGEALGARIVTCHTGWTSSQADPAEVRNNLRASLAQLSQEAGTVKVALEVADWFMPMERYELLRDLRLPNVGITVDIGHAHFDCPPTKPGGQPKPAYAAYGDVAGFIRAFGDLILGMHIHDYDGERDHIALGDGFIDLPPILRALHEVRYDGDLTLELNPDLCGPEAVLRSKLLLERLAFPPDDEPLPPWVA